MRNQTTISEKPIEAMLSCYADTQNFNEVARKFNCSAYAIRKQWSSLSLKEREKFMSDSKQRKDEAVTEYVVNHHEAVINSMALTLKVRDNILTKLDQAVDSITGSKIGNIMLLKEAANTLKSVASITVESQKEGTDELTKLLDKFRQNSIIDN